MHAAPSATDTARGILRVRCRNLGEVRLEGHDSTGITDAKSVTAEHNNMPNEEPSQMSMQNGP